MRTALFVLLLPFSACVTPNPLSNAADQGPGTSGGDASVGTDLGSLEDTDQGSEDSDGGVIGGDMSSMLPSGDGGVIGTASKCSGSAYRVCDGFEGASIDSSIWSTVITNGATVKLDSTHVARGKKALYVHTSQVTAGTNGGVRTTKGFPFPQNDIWGRAFVYMANHSPDQHTNVIEAVGNLPGGVTSHYRIGVTTNHVIGGNYIPGDYADRSANPMPLDKWTCFEWHFDGKNSEYHFYLDGAELTMMAITSNHTPPWTAPQFAYLEMGMHLYHDLAGITNLDAWYDEIALDSARIGCSN